LKKYVSKINGEIKGIIMYNSELSLFQRGSESIWTDEHISKSMLDAHLDETNDAASRKPENRIKIINWINRPLRKLT
jgi:hypothetical protein